MQDQYIQTMKKADLYLLQLSFQYLYVLFVVDYVRC